MGTKWSKVGAEELKGEMVGAFGTCFGDPWRGLQQTQEHEEGVSEVGIFLFPSLPY